MYCSECEYIKKLHQVREYNQKPTIYHCFRYPPDVDNKRPVITVITEVCGEFLRTKKK